MAITSINGFKILKKALSGIYELSENSVKTKIIMEKDGVLFFEYFTNDGLKAKHSDKKKIIFDKIGSVIQLPDQAYYIEIELEKDSAVTIETKGYAEFKD